MDFVYIFIIAVSAVVLIVTVVGFVYIIKAARDISAIQRAIFLFMRQKFGDLEELLKP